MASRLALQWRRGKKDLADASGAHGSACTQMTKLHARLFSQRTLTQCHRADAPTTRSSKLAHGGCAALYASCTPCGV